MNILGFNIDELSKREIGELAATDPLFAALFFVANQPYEYYNEATERGYDGEHPEKDPSELAEWIHDLAKTNPKQAAEILASIPYEPDAANFTGDVPRPSWHKKGDLSGVAPEQAGGGPQLLSDGGGSGAQTDDGGSGSESGSSVDWGGIGETAGAIAPMICGFVDSCDTSAYGGQQQQQRRQKRSNPWPWVIGGGVLVTIIVVAIAYNR